jgi:HSP20 family protein
MVVNRWNPWNDVFSAHEQLYTDALGRSLMPDMPERYMHTLPLDIRQSDDAFEIEASVPGYRPEDVDITFDDNVLTIRGTRHEDEVMRGTYVRRERNAHSVYRQVSLPTEVKTDEITASFDNGVLTITVPRTQRAQPKRIPVIATAAHTKLIESGAKEPVAV